MEFFNLFELAQREDRVNKYADWKPEPLPDLSGVKEVVIDFETNGLKWWDGHRPGGLAYYTDDGRSGYVPWAHQGDPTNLDEETVKRWFRQELKGKRITGAGVKTEIHMAHVWGCDLEEMGCEVSDVQHHAALLDDTRKRFSLEELCKEFLPDEKKVLAVDGETLNGQYMMEYPAGMMAVRAIADARQTWKLKELFWEELTRQDLHRVRQLEDECNFATCEMERNAQPIDLDLLKQWQAAAKDRLHGYARKISEDLGFLFWPTKAKAWEQLFEKTAPQYLGDLERTASGQVTTKYEVLRPYGELNPYIAIALKAMKLAELRSNFIDKYANTVGPDGLLRYQLHQLRSDEGGTITGRFASSKITINGEEFGANIQQVPDIRKSIDKGHDPEFLIRKLFVGGPEGDFLSADAAQIEYRLFSCYAKRREVLDGYRNDPDMSFHKMVWKLVLDYKPDLSYEHCKNINFMKLYGGGLVKLALMMGHITELQAKQLRNDYRPKSPPRDHPLLARAAEVDALYSRALPEVREISRKMEEAAINRGYVTDFLGRRTRDYQKRPYKALNGVIQGGAGSILKAKMVQAHRHRKRIGFIPRLTVHDELCGTAVDGQETKRLLTELLNEQLFPQLIVPIRWEAKIGENWAVC